MGTFAGAGDEGGPGASRAVIAIRYTAGLGLYRWTVSAESVRSKGSGMINER